MPPQMQFVTTFHASKVMAMAIHQSFLFTLVLRQTPIRTKTFPTFRHRLLTLSTFCAQLNCHTASKIFNARIVLRSRGRQLGCRSFPESEQDSLQVFEKTTTSNLRWSPAPLSSVRNSEQTSRRLGTNERPATMTEPPLGVLQKRN